MKSKMLTSSLLCSLPVSFFQGRRCIELDSLVPVADDAIDVDVVLAMLAETGGCAQATTIADKVGVDRQEQDTVKCDAAISTCKKDEVGEERLQRDTIKCNEAISACEEVEVGEEKPQRDTIKCNAALSACEKDKVGEERQERYTIKCNAAIIAGEKDEVGDDRQERYTIKCNAAISAGEKDEVGKERPQRDTIMCNAAISFCEKDEAGDDRQERDTIKCNTAIGASESGGLFDFFSPLEWVELRAVSPVHSSALDSCTSVCDFLAACDVRGAVQDEDRPGLDEQQVEMLDELDHDLDASTYNSAIEQVRSGTMDAREYLRSLPWGDPDASPCKLCPRRLSEWEIRNYEGHCEFCYHECLGRSP